MTHPASPPSPEALLEHREWIRAIARSLVADENVVDDIEQRTWLTVLRNRRPVASARGWLRRVVRSAVVDEHRTNSRRHAREQAAGRPEALPPTDHLAAQAEAQRVVAQAVTALPEPCRTTVLLRYFEGLSLDEVAARMGAPVTTVQTRLRRAHSLLRGALDGEFGDRRAWCLALLPLTRTRSPIPVGAATAGATLMAAKAKLVAAAVVLVVLSIGAWWAVDRAPAANDVAVQDGTSVAERSSSRVRAAAPAPNDPPATAVVWPFGVDVVDAASRPIAGARVEVTRDTSDRSSSEDRLLVDPLVLDAEDETAHSATTSSSGAADVTGIAAGRWKLRAVAVGFALHEERILIGGPSPRRRVVLVRASVLTGSVQRADGSAAGGATVFVGDCRGTTTPAGLFRIESLGPGGAHDVRVRLGGVVQEFGMVSVPQVTELNLRLRGGCGLRGRVVDDTTGAPVAGAHVTFRTTVYAGLGGMLGVGADAVSDAEGRFGWTDLPSSIPYFLGVTRDGYVALRSGKEALPPGFHLVAELTPTVELRLKRGAVVRGRVLGHGGAPVAGAIVDVITRTGTTPSAVTSDIVATAADGVFRVAAQPGTALVRARGPGVVQRDFPADMWKAVRDDAIPAACRVVVAAQGETAIDVVVTSDPAAHGSGTLSGILRSQDSRSVGGILLELWGNADPTGSHRFAVTDETGAFRFEGLAAGKYFIRGVDAVCSRGGPDLVVPENGSCAGVQLDLSREWTISGHVVDGAGAPVVGAALRAEPSMWAGTGPAVATSGPDGSFVVGRLSEREWFVVVQARGFAPVGRMIAAGAENVELRLERALAISGTVVDAESGAPLPGVPLHAEFSAGRQGSVLYRETASDSRGSFVLTDLAPDVYRVVVGPMQERWPWGAGEFVRTSLDGVRAGRTDVRVPVTRGLAISGRVTDGRGAPVGGGVVDAIVRAQRNDRQTEVACRTRVGPDGEFRIAGLAPGAYDLALGDDGRDPGPVHVEGVAAGTSDVVVLAQAPQVIEGRLHIEDGSPLPQGPGTLEARWTKPDGTMDVQHLGMVWDTDGRFRTNLLDPQGIYDVVVLIPNRLGAVVRGVRPGTHDLDILVAEGAQIDGRVVDDAGVPVPSGVWVSANAVGVASRDGRSRMEPGESVFAQTGAGGRFVLCGMAARPYDLRAGGAPSDFIRTEAPTAVTPGAGPVELRVARGVSLSGRLVDAKGAPLRDVFVRVTQHGDSVASDEKGLFTLRALAPGRFPVFAQVGSRIIAIGEADVPGDGLEFTIRDE